MVKRLMLGVRVTDEMMAALKIEAAKERRTVSAWVENLLFDDLSKRGYGVDDASNLRDGGAGSGKGRDK